MTRPGLAVSAALTFAFVAYGARAATTDLSINTASYSFASYDASGAPIANNVASGGGDDDTNNDVPFWTASTSFFLTSLSGAYLHISDLGADDRVVVELNGVAIDSAGIYGPGAGSFVFVPGGPLAPESFNANGAQDLTVLPPLLQLGSNTLTLIVNNTNDGIYGGLTGGPSSVFFSGTVTDGVVTPGVPEPATWVLMLSGFGLAGIAARRRRALAC